MGFPAYLTGRNVANTADRIVTMYDGVDAGTNIVGVKLFVEDDGGNTVAGRNAAGAGSTGGAWEGLWSQDTPLSVSSGTVLVGGMIDMDGWSKIQGHFLSSVAGTLKLRWSARSDLAYYTEDAPITIAAGVGYAFEFDWKGRYAQFTWTSSSTNDIRGQTRKTKLL